MKRSNFEAGNPGECMVEIVGPDGLKHHVGPFKVRADAEAWINQNPSDPIQKTPSRGEKSAARMNARLVE